MVDGPPGDDQLARPSRGRAIAEIAGLVAGLGAALGVPIWLAKAIVGDGSMGAAGTFLVIPALQHIGRWYRRRGRVPIWDGLADTRMAIELAIWFGIVAFLWGGEIWLSGVGDVVTFPIVTGLFSGAVATCLVAIHRSFDHDAPLLPGRRPRRERPDPHR